MAAQADLKFLSQADFARRRGVSKKAVTVWKQKDLLVFNDAGLVDVDQSEWKLDQRPATYRGGVTHRPIRTKVTGQAVQKPTAAEPKRAKASRQAPRPSDRPEDDEAQPDLDPSSAHLPMPEAVRRKENFLGLLRKHEFEVANREWVRIEDVGTQVERDYSIVRDRLLGIPGKVAARLVGADRGVIEATLKAEITEALHELHDPAGFAERIGPGPAAAQKPPGPSTAA